MTSMKPTEGRSAMSADARTQALSKLFDLLAARNAIDRLIAARIGRPAEKGHIGELVAAWLFDIELNADAAQRGHDGHFRSGPLAGRSVNIKVYGKSEGILDIQPEHLPDYFLVLTGRRGDATSSRGTTRPLVIEQIFLFESAKLINELGTRKVGTATSVPAHLWAAAQIYPPGTDPRLPIDPAHVELLQRLARSA
jgi:hypothetical protein